MQSIDRRVRASVFELLIGGSVDVTPSAIAVATDLAIEAVAASLIRLSDEHRLVLSEDGTRVVMAHPFSGVETPYRTEIGERSWWANCAWDAFGILILLGDGRVVANPLGRFETVWTVRGGRVEPDGIVHFVVPAARFWDDIGFT